MNPLLWLAFTGLRSSRTFVLLVVAVGVGAGFQMSNDANLDGFTVDVLDDVLAHGNGDVRVRPRDRLRFEYADAEARTLASEAGASAAVPVLSFPGAIGVADRPMRPVSINGVDASIARPPFRLAEGRPLAAGGEPLGALVGAALAKRLGVSVGDAIELRVILGPRDEVLGDSNIVALHSTVRGIATGTGTGGAYQSVFLDRVALEKLIAMPDAASMIALHLPDHDGARAVATRIEATHPDLEARAWADDDPGLASYLGVRRAIGGISYAMVIAAIAIPMWALLFIHVMRRQRELAILAALGFRRGELFAICSLQAAAVAVIGCALGAVIGYALTCYFAQNPLFSWQSLVIKPLVRPATFIVPSTILVATSLVAALHPAVRASRVAPAAALRRIE